MSERSRGWLPSRPVVCLLAFVCLAGGCNETEPGLLPLHPVSGQVLVDGKPAGRVQLTFHALRLAAADENYTVAHRIRPFAVSQPDGSFAPSTYRAGDGLPRVNTR